MTNSNNPFGHGANATPQPTNEVLQLLHLQIQALAKQVDTLTQAQNILQKKVVHLEGLLNPNLPGSAGGSAPSAESMGGKPLQLDALPPLETFGYVDWEQPQPSNARTPASSSPLPLTPTEQPNLWDPLVIQYNEDPGFYEPDALPVSETPASIDRRRKYGESKLVTLGPTSHPNYWVIKLSEESGYWLVPKANLKVTGASFDTLQSLFQVQGQPTQRLTLVKPAAVHIGQNHEWELVTQGEIRFL
jgi:hypothetical protein